MPSGRSFAAGGAGRFAGAGGAPRAPSAARGGAGFAMHSHDQTWLALLAGAKEWAVAPPHREDVAPWSAEALRCVQTAGDVVVLPSRWWHSTSAVP